MVTAVDIFQKLEEAKTCRSVGLKLSLSSLELDPGPPFRLEILRPFGHQAGGWQ